MVIFWSKNRFVVDFEFKNQSMVKQIFELTLVKMLGNKGSSTNIRNNTIKALEMVVHHESQERQQ